MLVLLIQSTLPFLLQTVRNGRTLFGSPSRTLQEEIRSRRARSGECRVSSILKLPQTTPTSWYVYVHMHIYMNTYVYINANIYICIYTNAHAHTYTYTCMYLYTYNHELLYCVTYVILHMRGLFLTTKSLVTQRARGVFCWHVFNNIPSINSL